MTPRNEQPTLFELTAYDEFEPPQGLAPGHAPASVTLESDQSIPEGSVSSREAGVFRAVSPWASIPLHEICAACGREITGTGFVILDYEELGAFCDHDCGDKRFRSYLYEAPSEGTPQGLLLGRRRLLDLREGLREQSLSFPFGKDTRTLLCWACLH